MFLCGGNGSPRRDRLAEYLRKPPHDLLIFYADKVWPALAKIPGKNALEMEADLANLADIVIIIVESPGTFAELGAFSLSQELRKKLLPIVGIAYRSENSFINTGPLKWIESDSTFAPPIWTHLDQILTAALAVDQRLRLLPFAHQSRISDLSISPKHLLFFICDLVAILGPCDAATIEATVSDILTAPPTIDIVSLLSLAEAMALISEVMSGDSLYYYSPLDPDGRIRPFHKGPYFDISGMRAEFLSVLQCIDEAREVLAAMRRTP